MQDNYKEIRAKSKKFVRYADGAELYSMSVSKFMQLAKDARNVGRYHRSIYEPTQ